MPDPLTNARDVLASPPPCPECGKTLTEIRIPADEDGPEMWLYRCHDVDDCGWEWWDREEREAVLTAPWTAPVAEALRALVAEHEQAKRQIEALGAWQCEICGCRFDTLPGPDIDKAKLWLQGVTYCSSCAKVEAQKGTIAELRADRERLQAILDAERAITGEIRLNEDGTLDEVVGRGLYHIEQMDDGLWFLDLGGVAMTLGSPDQETIPVVAISRDYDTWAQAKEAARKEQG